MIDSDDLAFFAVLASARSLADGARRLNVSPPAVTQRLNALEARLGVRLIDRSGRRLSLTDEGGLVASHGAAVADTLDALKEALANRRGAVTGHLRIAAPHGFGRLHVAPVLEAFTRAHPMITASLELADHPGASAIDSCDVVIHIGPPGPANRIVTTLAPNQRVLCASPRYLDAVPPIGSPADLAQHRCLVVRENDEDVTLWRFGRGQRNTATVRIHPVMSSNDGAVVRDWALAGQGITVRSEWHVADDLSAGRLRRVLPDWELPAADVVAMLGARSASSARTQSFVNLMRESLKPPPWRRAARARRS
jgi:DNA-binding transcriptional LysR family regulator